MPESIFSAAKRYQPARTVEYRGATLPADFGSAADEFHAARFAAALFDRSDRGLLRLTGRDRLAWLHNLVTQSVKDMTPGDGRYSFAVDVRGRTRFDLNILALDDELWLDVDAATAAEARAHLDRYLITEDVQIAPAGDGWARLGVGGPQTPAVAAGLGVTNLLARPPLAHQPICDGAARLVRHDFAGAAGFELIVPREAAAAWWDRLAGAAGVRPAGFFALDALRIDAGIPWLGRDIDEKVIPPETGAAERSISYKKGCYLGQEVIERMRSYGSMARRLVRFRVAADAAGWRAAAGEPPAGLVLPAALHKDGKEAGRVTSLVKHPLEAAFIGLGYLRTNLSDATGLTMGEPAVAIEVVEGA